MARAGSDTSKLNRRKVVAYARKTKGEGGGESTSGEPPAEPAAVTPAPASDPASATAPTAGAPGPGADPAPSEAAPVEPGTAPPAPVEPPAPAPAAPAPAATAPAATAPAAGGASGPSMFGRNKGETIAMPPNLSMGSAPELPGAEAAAAPTWLPGARDVPTGDASTAAAAPGAVPRGDSRSLRKGDEFALVYRKQTFVITRTGTVGMQGTWRVVEYPTLGAASNAYAHQCSRFVADGFSDYR